jgi:hypothetical protein
VPIANPGFDVLSAIQQNDPKLDEAFSSFFAKVRGHMDYWKEIRRELQSMM